MRPVRRGKSPKTTDFDDYSKAKPDLISAMGMYCSYCERPIKTGLAVEHIQAKSKYPHLIGKWENFLLACINCNSTKLDKELVLEQVLLPDRDNTAAAFTYLPDGTIHCSDMTEKKGAQAIASETLALTGLDKKISKTYDVNGKQIAIDRVAQRLEVWAKAKDAKADIKSAPGNEALRRMAVELAKSEGFFSIWMTVFADDIDMRQRLIDAFPGTKASACFDSKDTSLISPSPNLDNLEGGGKI